MTGRTELIGRIDDLLANDSTWEVILHFILELDALELHLLNFKFERKLSLKKTATEIEQRRLALKCLRQARHRLVYDGQAQTFTDINSFVDKHAAEFPNTVAIKDDIVAVTWSEFKMKVELITSPSTERCISVTSCGRSSISSTMR